MLGGAWEGVLPESLGQLLVSEGGRTGLQDSEHFVVYCSESGTFLGLGMITGSVAIYIAFSLQVMDGGGHSLWEARRPVLLCVQTGAWPGL